MVEEKKCPVCFGRKKCKTCNGGGKLGKEDCQICDGTGKCPRCKGKPIGSYTFEKRAPLI